VFRIQKADQGSVSFADSYKITEAVVDPHVPETSAGALATAGTSFDLLADTGHTVNTGSAGTQSFSEGDKILAGITVSSNYASGGTRGALTWVFRSIGGLSVS
jgi:hypothetical protein